MENQDKLGKTLINNGYITNYQLTKALDYQLRLDKKYQMTLSEILISMSYVTDENIEDALKGIKAKQEDHLPPPPPKTNSRKPLGKILIERGFIDHQQLTSALEYQSKLQPKYHKPLGEILIDLDYITREQLDLALDKQPKLPNNSLGEILKQLGLVDASQLSIILSQQYAMQDKSVPLGKLLVQHGFITAEQLNIALNKQKNKQ